MTAEKNKPRFCVLPSNAGSDDGHYKALFERHMADSTRYQALLFHSWKSLREQQKGLRRQARKIKQLKQKIADLTHDMDGLVDSRERAV